MIDFQDGNDAVLHDLISLDEPDRSPSPPPSPTARIATPKDKTIPVRTVSYTTAVLPFPHSAMANANTIPSCIDGSTLGHPQPTISSSLANRADQGGDADLIAANQNAKSGAFGGTAALSATPNGQH